ncbi:MAG: 50S ribosomal protein L11 methyltransferase [Prevotellaceae bacterium]|jgi:ribosomal protein L11 methyltransferase|nr:50S ribosomal protein L11 methyltransferase [Prevotellaceae bacterium]
MNYIEVKITLHPCTEAHREILIAELAENGYESFAETGEGFNAYIPVHDYDERRLKILFFSYREQTGISYATEHIMEQNWNAQWEACFEPVVVDGLCTVRAPFHKNLPKTAYEIVMEPKMAFGTGHHHTTYLLLQALLEIPLENLQVLDMGCGTGILAILAAKCGAKKFVDAIDVNLQAKNSALENARRNRVAQKIRVLLGDAALIQRNKYHLILANINRNILMEDMKTYAMGLKPRGVLLASGIYENDVDAVAAEAAQYDLCEIDRRTRHAWAMAAFQKRIRN